MFLTIVITVQVIHLVYHQLTTVVDFYPFNSARFYSTKEKLIESGVNLVLMGLPPLGYALHHQGLMTFGLIYYLCLFGGEIATWWIPYWFKSSSEWNETYDRLHKNTIIVLPARGVNPIPNLEHMILHLITLLTGILTAIYFLNLHH